MRERSKEMKQVCSDPWDAQYIDKIGDTRQDLYDLILAANYLDIKSLLHLHQLFPWDILFYYYVYL